MFLFCLVLENLLIHFLPFFPQKFPASQKEIELLRSLWSQDSRSSVFLSSFSPSRRNLHRADGNSHCSCWWAVGSSKLLCICRLQSSYLVLVTVRDLQRHILGTHTYKQGLSKTQSVRSELRITLSTSYLNKRTLWPEADRRPGENWTFSPPQTH